MELVIVRHITSIKQIYALLLPHVSETLLLKVVGAHIQRFANVFRSIVIKYSVQPFIP